MRRVLIVTTAIAVLVVSPAGAQLVGEPSGQGGAAPTPPNARQPPQPCKTRRGIPESGHHPLAT